LAHVGACRGATEVELFGDHHERLELVQVHRAGIVGRDSRTESLGRKLLLDSAETYRLTGDDVGRTRTEPRHPRCQRRDVHA
jgi:hypothetical protein